MFAVDLNSSVIGTPTEYFVLGERSNISKSLSEKVDA